MATTTCKGCAHNRDGLCEIAPHAEIGGGISLGDWCRPDYLYAHSEDPWTRGAADALEREREDVIRRFFSSHNPDERRALREIYRAMLNLRRPVDK